MVLVVGKKQTLPAKADVRDKGSYSSILALRIPRTEESGWLQSIVHKELDRTRMTQHECM